MKECGSYGCKKKPGLFGGGRGWKTFKSPCFGGTELVSYCPDHVQDGRESTEVTCKHCGEKAFLADNPAGWDYVHTPAGTLWFCAKHIA